MRSSRFVSALVALVLGFSLVGLVVTPAQAAKPPHDVTAIPGKAPSGQLFIKGKVSTLPNGTITIQRKDKGKTWKLFATTGTNAKGKYKVNVDGPSKACFRVVVPKTADYKKTIKNVACLQ